MGLESLLPRARLGIAATTAGLGMLLGGCGTTVHWDNVEKLGMLGLGVVGGANAQTPLQAAAADVVTATAQNEIYADQQARVAAAGKSETNVYVGNEQTIQNNSTYPRYHNPPMRPMKASRFHDLNGNGIADSPAEKIPADGNFNLGETVVFTINNYNVPPVYAKMVVEAQLPEGRWVTIVETGLARLVEGNESSWTCEPIWLGKGTCRATVYEVWPDDRQFKIGEQYIFIHETNPVKPMATESAPKKPSKYLETVKNNTI